MNISYGVKIIEFVFAGINIVWRQLRLPFAQALGLGLKGVLLRVRNVFLNWQFYSIVITLSGINKINRIKAENNEKRTDWTLFHLRSIARKQRQGWFWWPGYIVRSFDSPFSFVCFRGASRKVLFLARKMPDDFKLINVCIIAKLNQFKVDLILNCRL